jgi:hypothetical protein
LVTCLWTKRKKNESDTAQTRNHTPPIASAWIIVALERGSHLRRYLMALILAENIIYYWMENSLSMLPPKGVNHVFDNENPGDASSTGKLYFNSSFSEAWLLQFVLHTGTGVVSSEWCSLTNFFLLNQEQGIDA